MAFEMFTGNVPFHDSEAPMAILLRHVNEPIAPVKSIRPEVDQRISDWVERLLVKEPDQRTQNAQDAWDDFEEILLSLLGPRWRREARLVETRPDTNGGGAKPLTPGAVLGHQRGRRRLRGVQVLRVGRSPSDTGGSPAAPPMWTPPPSESTPAIPEPIVGPPTPMPSQAIPAPPAAGRRPLAAPPGRGRRADRRHRVRDLRRARTGSAERRADPRGADARARAGRRGGRARRRARAGRRQAIPESFETYVAPPPSRPPTSEPPAVTPPPVRAPPPVVEQMPPLAPMPEPAVASAPRRPRRPARTSSRRR